MRRTNLTKVRYNKKNTSKGTTPKLHPLYIITPTSSLRVKNKMETREYNKQRQKNTESKREGKE